MRKVGSAQSQGTAESVADGHVCGASSEGVRDRGRDPCGLRTTRPGGDGDFAAADAGWLGDISTFTGSTGSVDADTGGGDGRVGALSHKNTTRIWTSAGNHATGPGTG